MGHAAGFFQFFFSSKERTLPHPSIPTRDVTNTWGAGNKTEPHLERMLENWCPCRARFVTAKVKQALETLDQGSKHWMILTTNHPTTGKELAVGVLDFSVTDYKSLISSFPARWSPKTYLPYAGSRRSKLVSFHDGFRLRPWMKRAKKRHLPGKRYGVINAETALLNDILAHFNSLRDQTSKFLINVNYLENLLKNGQSPRRWRNYLGRKNGVTRRC
jgi:hypothetical protein